MKYIQDLGREANPWGSVRLLLEVTPNPLYCFRITDSFQKFAGKKREDIENFINEGVYQVERLKEDGWITDIKYDDEV